MNFVRLSTCTSLQGKFWSYRDKKSMSVAPRHVEKHVENENKKYFVFKLVTVQVQTKRANESDQMTLVPIAY